MKNDQTVLVLLGALIAGHAVYWFIGGKFHDYTTVRNTFVVLQFLIGMTMIFYNWKLKKSK